MADLYHDHHQLICTDLIDNAVIAHADSIEGLLRMELPSTHREEIFRKTINAPSKSLLDFSFESGKLTLSMQG
jgi:hypothetical protein